MGSVSTARFGSEFEAFLYASVGQDNDGMPLTVLSALARQDIDPWEEAAKLTQLPQERAVTQLACLLGTLRNTPQAACPDPVRLAAPLIALLPRGLTALGPTKRPAVISVLVSVLTYLIFMLFSNWMMGSFQTPREAQAPPASTPAADSAQSPPSGDTP